MKLYFAADGSWGNAEGMVILEGSALTVEQLEEIDQCDDETRYEIAKMVDSITKTK